MTPPSSCAIVGVGVLGTSLCRQILLESEDAKLQNVVLTGITKSTSRHDDIRKRVFTNKSSTEKNNQQEQQRLRLLTSEQAYESSETFDHVVFCAPPSGFDDYPKAVRDAADKLWNRQGTFVFTSSGGM
jgi:homoserine dehydrogenase